MTAVDVDVTFSGPFFAGHPSAEMGRGIRDGVDAVSDESVRFVQGELDTVLVNPTGRYRRRITYSLRADNTEGFVGDNRAIYGPWLSGDSSANTRSRFKGYSHWRRATQRMEQRAPVIAEEHIARAVRKLT